MPAPATADEFLDLIRKSGVVDESRLSAYVKQLQTASNVPTNDMSKYAGLFVRDGLLTFFQAEQFLLGKWKRFTIGKYKVLERLGSGGMGQVFLCEHKLMRRKVAVKVLPTAKAEDPSSLERFYREARAVAALDHPNIVRAYDIDQDDNLHFLVMEYVDGASLQDIIKKHGPMDVLRACHYMYWSAIGLEHAHEAGLIHRDIKPGNILIDRLGTVKLLDMGLARFFNDDEDLLTKKYDENVLGTADYLAPEQALDSHGVDGRADIYSLGATFYFLLSGAQPFVEGTVAQKLIWHQTRNPKSIRDVRPDVPEGVAAIVEKMMAKDPANRYQVPAELAEALAPWVQTPIGPPPDKEMPTLSAAAQSVGGGGGTTTVVRQVPQTPKSGNGSGTKQQSSSPEPTAANSKPASGSPAQKQGSEKKVEKAGSEKRGSNNSVPAARAPAPPSTPEVSDSEATARRSNPAPIIESMPADSEPAVWEAISQDTNNTARDNTDRQQSPPKSKPKIKPVRPTKKESVEPEQKPATQTRSSRSGKHAAKKPLPKKLIIWIAGGVAGLVLLIVLLVAFREPSKPTDVTPTAVPSNVTVGKSGADFKSVRDALGKVKDGAHITIVDSPWEEALTYSRNDPKNVVIEGAEGKDVVWKVPSSSATRPILSLSSPEGLKFRHLILDGETFKEPIESAIQVTGNVNGLTFEDLSIRNVKLNGIWLQKCVATESERMTIQRVRIVNDSKTPTECAINFIAPGIDTPNQWITVQNCIIAGPFKAAFQFQGHAVDITLRENRVWNADDCINFREAPKTSHLVTRLEVTNNTFVNFTNALHFKNAATLALQPDPKNRKIDLRQNYFCATRPGGVVMRSDDGQTFPAQFENNGRNPETQDGLGVPPGKIFVIEAKPPADVNPNDDNFLRFPKATEQQFRVGDKQKVPVGAQ